MGHGRSSYNSWNLQGDLYRIGQWRDLFSNIGGGGRGGRGGGHRSRDRDYEPTPEKAAVAKNFDYDAFKLVAPPEVIAAQSDPKISLKDAAVDYFLDLALLEERIIATDGIKEPHPDLSRLREAFTTDIPTIKNEAIQAQAMYLTAGFTELVYQNGSDRDFYETNTGEKVEANPVYHFKDSRGALTLSYDDVKGYYSEGLKDSSLLVGTGKGQFAPIKSREHYNELIEEMTKVVPDLIEKSGSEAAMKQGFDRVQSIFTRGGEIENVEQRDKFILDGLIQVRADLGTRKAVAPAQEPRSAGEKVSDGAKYLREDGVKYLSEELGKAKGELKKLAAEGGRFAGEVVKFSLETAEIASRNYAVGLTQTADYVVDGNRANSGSHANDKYMLGAVNLDGFDSNAPKEGIGAYLQPKVDSSGKLTGEVGYHIVYSASDGSRTPIEPPPASRLKIHVATTKYDAIEKAVLTEVKKASPELISSVHSAINGIKGVTAADRTKIMADLETFKTKHAAEYKIITGSYDEMISTVHGEVKMFKESIKANPDIGLKSGQELLGKIELDHLNLINGASVAVDKDGKKVEAEKSKSPTEEKMPVVEGVGAHKTFYDVMAVKPFTDHSLNKPGEPAITTYGQAMAQYPVPDAMNQQIMGALETWDIDPATKRKVAISAEEGKEIAQSLSAYYQAKSGINALGRVKDITLTGGQKAVNWLAGLTSDAVPYKASITADPDYAAFDKAFGNLAPTFGVEGYANSVVLLSDDLKLKVMNDIAGGVAEKGKVTGDRRESVADLIEFSVVKAALDSKNYTSSARAEAVNVYFGKGFSKQADGTYDYGVYTQALHSEYASSELVDKAGFKGTEQEFRAACLDKCFIQAIDSSTSLADIQEVLGKGVTAENRLIVVGSLQVEMKDKVLNQSQINAVLEQRGIDVAAVRQETEAEQKTQVAATDKAEPKPDALEKGEDTTKVASTDKAADAKPQEVDDAANRADLKLLVNGSPDGKADDVEPVLRLIARNGVEVPPELIQQLKDNPDLVTKTDISKALGVILDGKEKGLATQGQFQHAVYVAVTNMSEKDGKTEGLEGDLTDINTALVAVNKAMEVQGIDAQAQSAQLVETDTTAAQKDSGQSPT